MTCWSCGGGIPPGSNFCGLCGARQNPTDRITRSGWMRARDARLALPSAPPPTVETDPEEGRVTQINPAVLTEGAPEPAALLVPEASPTETRPRFAALAAAELRPKATSMVARAAEAPPTVTEPPPEPEPAPLLEQPQRAPLELPRLTVEAEPVEIKEESALAPDIETAPLGSGDLLPPTMTLSFSDRPSEPPRSRATLGLAIAGGLTLALVLLWFFR